MLPPHARVARAPCMHKLRVLVARNRSVLSRDCVAHGNGALLSHAPALPLRARIAIARSTL
eukprot:9380964-Lingulodinium_polyedra.AAC.1